MSGLESVADIEQKVTELKDMLSKPGNILYDMYHSNTPKKDAIREWAKNLEKLVNLNAVEYQTNQISTIIRQDLKAMGAEQAIHYAKEVLPFKYKNPQKIHSDEDTDESREVKHLEDSSPLLASDCKKYNANIIIRIDESADVLNRFSKLLKSKILLEADIPEDELESIFTMWDQANSRLNDVLDGREKVSDSTQFLMFYARTTATLNYCYGKYVTLVKDFASITSKQAGKILRGEIPRVLKLLEPKSRLDALASGFYGQVCSECGCWRTVYKYHSDGQASDDDRTAKPGGFDVFCLKCHWWMTPLTIAIEEDVKIDQE